jgi:hypothetical protein
MNAIKVRDIDAALIWRRIVLPVLVKVESKQYSVHAIDLLKHDHALAAKRELFRVALVRVTLPH